MKKLLCFFIILSVSMCFIFAAQKICITPFNQELSDYLSKGLGLTVNKAPKEYSSDYLLSGDKKLIELLLKESDSDSLVVPQITSKDGLNIFKIYLYDADTKNFNTVYSYLSQIETTFPVSVILSLMQNLTGKRQGLVKLENFKPGSTVLCDLKTVTPIDDYLILDEGKHTLKITSYGYKDIEKALEITAFEMLTVDVQMDEELYNNLTIKSDVKSFVLKDSVLLGETPYTLDSYSVPLIVRLKADGYADSIVNISKETKSIEVKMKPSWMENGEIYTEARDEFYRSFARSILVFGAKVAFKSLQSYQPQISKIGINASEILLAVSVTDLIYDLFNYARYAGFISP